MAYDILIKGGRIYDGSGLPSYLGDVAVKDGRIVETGRINGSAKRVLQRRRSSPFRRVSSTFTPISTPNYSGTRWRRPPATTA